MAFLCKGRVDVTERGKTVQIRQFIFDNLSSRPNDIASAICDRFHISRQAANVHLRDLEKSGAIESNGKTRSKTYKLCALAQIENFLPVSKLEEYEAWKEHIRPHLGDLKNNVLAVCEYGFTEMMNNVIDHSKSDQVLVKLLRTHNTIDIRLQDFGVGVFRKIKEAFALADELEAIKQLVKGKLTTDPTRHSGEGIFFTSRLFDCFTLLSGELYYSHVRQENDWLIEDKQKYCPGTMVRMTISTNATQTLKDVFDKFTTDDGDYAFSKTIVPISLIQYGDENLVSRSQAKRLLGRIDKFREVYLDFANVSSIGQAFADELFRVFSRQHPEVNLIPLNANQDVSKMIGRAKGAVPLEGQKELF